MQENAIFLIVLGADSTCDLSRLFSVSFWLKRLYTFTSENDMLVRMHSLTVLLLFGVVGVTLENLKRMRLELVSRVKHIEQLLNSGI